MKWKFVATFKKLHWYYAEAVQSNSYYYMEHVWGRKEMRREFLVGKLKKGDHLEDISIAGWIILKWVFGK
jgi:hypothetical protein